MIEQNLLVACNTQVKLEEEKNNLNLKKFVKSFKKMSKKGLIGDWVDADTLLRGLLHPSDYRKILHQIFVEPKVCSHRKYRALAIEFMGPPGLATSSIFFCFLFVKTH